MSRIEITLPREAVEQITVAGLRDAAETICRLTLSRVPAATHHFDDLQSNLRYLEALNIVLEYYGDVGVILSEVAAQQKKACPA